MQFICEIVPSSLLTPLRRIIASKLAEDGFKQVEIAEILGISQPVVSTYLKNPEVIESPLISRPAFQQVVSELYSQIKTGKTNKIDMMNVICNACQDFRTAGPLCDLHRKKAVLNFPPDCRICFPSTEQTVEFDQKLNATKELYEAAQALTQLGDRFGQLIPEIGCQFVYITPENQSTANIAAFPGRIVKVKGRGQIVSPPEFGHGSILAFILSFFRTHNSPYRALISLKRTDIVLKQISSHLRVVSTTEADKNWESTLKGLVGNDISTIDILEDSGGIGFEPILYLFGTSPSNIVDRIREYF